MKTITLCQQIESLRFKNSQLNSQVHRLENQNRKLCSENRRRRLTNNQLKRQQQHRQQNIYDFKGSIEEVNKLITNLKTDLGRSTKIVDQYCNQISELKLKQANLIQQNRVLQRNNQQLKNKVEQSEGERNKLKKMEHQIVMKSRLGRQRQNDYSKEIVTLISQNFELEQKLRDCQQTISDFYNKIQLSQQKIRNLLDELESNRQIIKILKLQHDLQIDELKNKQKSPNAFVEVLTKVIEMQRLKVLQVQQKRMPVMEIKNQITRGHPLYGDQLKNRIQSCCANLNLPHILYSQRQIQNLANQPVFLHYCQPFSTLKKGTWLTTINLTSDQQIFFGLTNQYFKTGYTQSMNYNRHFIYYNNCTGSIVVDKNGFLIQKYATKNDKLVITLIICDDKKIVRFSKNQQMLDQRQLPEYLKSAHLLYPFVKLFKDMSISVD